MVYMKVQDICSWVGDLLRRLHPPTEYGDIVMPFTILHFPDTAPTSDDDTPGSSPHLH